MKRKDDLHDRQVWAVVDYIVKLKNYPPYGNIIGIFSTYEKALGYIKQQTIERRFNLNTFPFFINYYEGKEALKEDNK